MTALSLVALVAVVALLAWETRPRRTEWIDPAHARAMAALRRASESR